MPIPDTYELLGRINRRPAPFSQYTAIELWNDEHISGQMLLAHLDEKRDAASRNRAFIQRSVRWMKSRFDINSSTRIVDFGCGPGLYTSEWAKMGAKVAGVDISSRSIAYARKSARDQNLYIDYIHADYLHLNSSNRYHLATLIYCDYCVLDPVQRRRLLRVIRKQLHPDGWVLFDVHSTVFLDSATESRSYEFKEDGGFWSPGPHYVFHNAYKYPQDQILLNQYTVVEPDNLRTFYNWVKCYSPESLEAELAENGLRVAEYYGNVAGDPLSENSEEIAVVANSTM